MFYYEVFMCMHSLWSQTCQVSVIHKEFQGNDDKRHHFTTFMLIKHLPHLFIYQLDKYLLHQ